MKKSISLFVLTILWSQIAFAVDARLVGSWQTQCTPNPEGGSIIRKAKMETNGTGINFATLFQTPDCTGPSQDSEPFRLTYNSFDETSNSVMFTATAQDPTSLPNHQPYWFSGTCQFLNLNQMSIHYTGAILNENGIPVTASAELLALMSTLVWTRP